MIKGVPIYLAKNLGRVNLIGVHDLGDWSLKYEAPEFASFKVMSELRSEFPTKKILREDVTRLFREGRTYLAFIAAMVWGFIDASRPRVAQGGKVTTNFYKVLARDSGEVVDVIEYVRHELLSGRIKSCFSELRRGGRYNISGIDYPYFTKLFFFLGQTAESIEVKPLIFDKWTTNAYFALLSQTRPGDVSRCFRGLQSSRTADSPGLALIRSGSALPPTYELYIKDMNMWASQLGVSPARLEQFVFGESLKANKRGDNPRKELWEISIANAKQCGVIVR